MFGFKHTRRRMSGGLYFGPPGWAPDQWEWLDPPDAEVGGMPAPAAPATGSELADVLEAANIGKTSPWMPSLRAQLMALDAPAVRTIVADFLPPQPESGLPHAIAALGLDDALRGLNAIRRCIKNKSTAIVLDRQDRVNRRRWRRATRKSGLHVVPILNVYPQGDSTVLIWTLLGKKLPVGALPLTAGVLLLDPLSCWALGRFLRCGATFQHQPVQVFSADAAPRLLVAPIGMSIDTLLQRAGLTAVGQQCIRNGMLAGEEISPAQNVVEEDTEIIALRPVPAAENPTPCIECGWCVDHCPTALNPAKLYHLAAAAPPNGEAREAQHCIDCGLCSYVCPTRLPLTQRIVELRSRFRQHAAAAH